MRGILPIMPLVPGYPCSVPGYPWSVPGYPGSFPACQFQDVPDSPCLMFYQQYNNGYNKLNLLGTMI